jgi:excisionase family DNA binding protein
VSEQKLLISFSEAAELLGLKPHQLYQLTRNRSRAKQIHPIPVCRLGKRIAFRREALEQWILQLEGADKANAKAVGQ